MWGSFGAWGWFALGLLLIAIETLAAPGTYLLWIGVAALAVGLVTSLVALGWAGELVLLGAFGLGFGYLGFRIYRGRGGLDAASGLNDPVANLIGRAFVLDQPIADGHGQIRVNDSVWRVEGPDLPVGARVRVTGSEGVTLKVEAV